MPTNVRWTAPCRRRRVTNHSCGIAQCFDRLEVGREDPNFHGLPRYPSKIVRLRRGAQAARVLLGRRPAVLNGPIPLRYHPPNRARAAPSAGTPVRGVGVEDIDLAPGRHSLITGVRSGYGPTWTSLQTRSREPVEARVRSLCGVVPSPVQQHFAGVGRTFTFLKRRPRRRIEGLD